MIFIPITFPIVASAEVASPAASGVCVPRCLRRPAVDKPLASSTNNTPFSMYDEIDVAVLVLNEAFRDAYLSE
jgi:hypothetical protein